MKTFFLILIFSSSVLSNCYSQTQIEGSEIGLEGFAGGSNMGGSFGIGLKYGMRFNENFIVGPSVRLMKSWSYNNGANFHYSIFGGGVFAHARYGNMVFGGVEFEVLNTPLFYSVVNKTNSHWVPTFFIGGGFSREFKEIIRINAGVFYDVINNVNSPFRTSYMMTKTNPTTGQISGYIPVIYRISFFFRIGNNDKEEVIEEEE